MIKMKIDGNAVELRNLQEQVLKNKNDIEYIINEEGALNQFGLRVVGQVETVGDMPTVTDYKTNNPNWQYGDAYIAGASQIDANIVDVTDATLLVLTRANTVYPNDFWMNLGEFPKPGPTGPEGKQGEQGIQGEKGLDVLSGAGAPTTSPGTPDGTTYIDATTGNVYKYIYSGSGTTLIGNIKGPQGAVGATGATGATGPIGPTGAIGPQGPRGIGVNILGTLTSTSQLPDPTTVNKDSAYIIPVDGVNHLYVIEGTDSLVWTDFGTAGIGEKGDKGDAGIGIDTMTDLDLTYGDTTVTYDTTDGIGINGQARFTYNGGTTKDVTMDVSIPVVPGNGIVIDKKAGSEQVEIKADTDYFDGKYVPEQTTTDDYIYAYVYDKNGQTTIRAEKGIADNTIAIRHDGSRLYVGSPISEVDAVNLDYADKHYVGLQIPAATRSVVAINTDGTQELITLHGGSAVQGSIPLRSTGGVVRVGTPVASSDATTKAYVDGLHHYTHTVSLVGSSNTIYITIAAKGYPNPITAIDDAGATPSLSDLFLASGQSAKAMATGLVTDTNGDQGTVVALWSDNGSVIVQFIVNGALSSDSVLALDTYTITDIVA